FGVRPVAPGPVRLVEPGAMPQMTEPLADPAAGLPVRRVERLLVPVQGDHGFAGELLDDEAGGLLLGSAGGLGAGLRLLQEAPQGVDLGTAHVVTPHPGRTPRPDRPGHGGGPARRPTPARPARRPRRPAARGTRRPGTGSARSRTPAAAAAPRRSGPARAWRGPAHGQRSSRLLRS